MDENFFKAMMAMLQQGKTSGSGGIFGGMNLEELLSSVGVPGSTDSALSGILNAGTNIGVDAKSGKNLLSGITGGSKLPGMINVGAGILGSLLPGPDISTNKKGVSAGGFDFGAGMSRKQSKNYNKNMGIFNTATDLVGLIPGAGTIISPVLKLLGGLFPTKKASERDILSDYMADNRSRMQKTRTGLFSSSFDSNLAKYGGYLDSVLPGENGSIRNLEGQTHEQSPTGGETISYDSQGVPNKAQEGEVVVNFDNGDEFVFSNDIEVTAP